MEKLLTTTQLAEAIGASESSMRRWTNSGALRTARTVGGHRRIALSEAIRFVRESGATVVRPELLGLPEISATAAGKDLSGRALERTLYDALCSGDSAAARGCVAGLFLNGVSVASIFDEAVQVAMHRIGELWPQDPRAILVEHRAMNTCLLALGMLRQMLPEPIENAPVAVGGAPEGDPYLLPSLMAGTVLADAGYRDVNFGPDTPMDVLAVAAEENQAQVVWLSIKAVADRATLRTNVDNLAERLRSMQITLVVGGSGAELLAIRSSKNIHVMRTMGELAAFARGAAGGTLSPGKPE
ncbi:excisionase family DNA-binding protein [soil metagenome]